MIRLAIPIILVAAAIGLFVLYTNPSYQKIKELQEESASYEDALNKSQELRKLRDQLLSRRNTFPSEGVQKLEKILPDNVDNIRLIIDINNIAARHNLALKNVQLGSVSDSARQRSNLAVGSSGSPVGSVDIGFAVSATYDELLNFLLDLERSLRVVDVEKISFKSPQSGSSISDYAFNIRTYWLH